MEHTDAVTQHETLSEFIRTWQCSKHLSHQSVLEARRNRLAGGLQPKRRISCESTEGLERLLADLGVVRFKCKCGGRSGGAGFGLHGHMLD